MNCLNHFFLLLKRFFIDFMYTAEGIVFDRTSNQRNFRIRSIFDSVNICYCVCICHLHLDSLDVFKFLLAFLCLIHDQM